MHLEQIYHKTALANGVRVVSEEINHVRSVSIGIWVRSGSRYENHGSNGTAHFIEHMLFKGTDRRTAFDIASEIDSVGGIINAFTGKEWTSFYIKIPDYHLPIAIDLLADIFQNSRFQEEEIVKEKSVVLQEISMVEDSPDDYIHDFFEAVFWSRHPLGLPVLGTKDRILHLDRSNLLSFFHDRYAGDNLILAAAGHMKHETLVDLVNKTFGSMSKETAKVTINQPEVSSQVAVLERDLEQVHIMIGTIAPSVTSPKRYTGFLFQEIREKRGLAYAINSYIAPYVDTGMLGIYAGTGEGQVRLVVDLIFKEVKRLRDDLLTEKEMHAAKELIKGNFLLSMESTDNRMTRLATNEICFGKFIPSEDVIHNIEKVEMKDVRDLAREIFDPRIISMVAMGKVSENDLAHNF